MSPSLQHYNLSMEFIYVVLDKSFRPLVNVCSNVTFSNSLPNPRSHGLWMTPRLKIDSDRKNRFFDDKLHELLIIIDYTLANCGF